MTTLWAHLPSAASIDRIRDSFKANPACWKDITKFSATRVEIDVWNDAYDKIDAFISAEMFNKIFSMNQPWTIRAACMALIVYGECGYMLDSDPGELAILAKLGDERAILLLPACISLAKEKELSWAKDTSDTK